MSRCTFSIAAIAAISIAVASPATGQNLLLTNARIVDPVNREVAEGNILILVGYIAERPEAPPEDYFDEVIDLEGRWVIPGLIDLHIHSYGNIGPGNTFDSPGTPTVARRHLYAGVTGFLDLFAWEDAIFHLRQRQRAGEIIGADIFAAGPCFTLPLGHCTQYGTPTRTVETPEEAVREVTQLVAKRPDVIKIAYRHPGRRPAIDFPTLQAIVDTARHHRIKTVVHVASWDDVRDAATSGASAITRTPTDQVVPDDIVELLVEREVWSIPTLTMHTEIRAFKENPELLESPLLQTLTTEAIINSYRNIESIGGFAMRMLQWQTETSETVLQSIGKMHEAGVPIVAGTDSGNTGMIQGYSLHRELMKLVEAGFSPWDALAAATTRAGTFLHRSYGVRPGDEANLVVLDASPIDDIRNTQRIHMVIHHGKVIDRDWLLGRTPLTESRD